MWDRLRTATSTATSATATPASAATTNTAFASADDFLHHPPRHHAASSSKPRRGASVSKHKQRIPRIRSPRSRRPDSLDDPLNALGISRNGPYKLEVRRGKVVPRLSSVDVVLPSQQQDLLAAPGREPPPRDPRRRLQQHHQLNQSDSHWRPTSSVYDDSDDTIKDADHTGPVKQASGDMYSRPAAEEQVSPPSSPEPGAFHGGHAAGDVSPIDEELDRFQQQLLGGPLQQHPGRPASQQQRSQIPSLQHAHHLPRSTLGPSAPQLRQPTPENRAWEHQVHPGQRPAPQQNTMARERAVEPPNPPQAYGSTTPTTVAWSKWSDEADQTLDEPPVPALPALATSVMDRRRPVAGEHNDRATPEPIVISMSSPYSASSHEPVHERTAHARIASESQQSDRRSSVLSMAKPLPPAPHEQSSSNDRVANLNAQIQGLVHRRINITRSIKQMTELMPADNLLASEEVLRKREVEKQKVDTLRGELAEVQREEYELGLKLHRAYKRLDQDAEYEPTTLWVRRVTG
ncbi:hypothetical protein PLIIFM63780_007316 [Purpureocillium lilacinum]|nr:hypothetical protein PLIIFM63780_007316 [Purpureocillium lilacinum]